jgi:hypothetical protein
MSFSALNIDPGASPTAPVAVRLRGGANFQGVTPIHGDQATDEYDSGLITLPAVDTQLVAGRIYIGNLFVRNHSDEVRRVTIQNAAQSIRLLDEHELQPGEILNINRGGAEIVGVRWSADVAASVVAQIKGWQ